MTGLPGYCDIVTRSMLNKKREKWFEVRNPLIE